MQFLDPALEAYCEANSGTEPPYLQDLARETREKVAMPQMLSGALQGRFLALMSRMVAPRTIVELGTYTG
jgi:caffeoyl-CoA O-methyltransferase